jgi:AAA domain
MMPHEDLTSEQVPAAFDSQVDQINWPTFWEEDTSFEDFLLWPLVARNRATALYSRAKAGKSLLALEMVANVASGIPNLFGEVVEPFDIVYLDYEMTRADLRERLHDMGFGPESDLSRLHYFQLPQLDALDGTKGGDSLCELALKCNAQLVVIDTMSRVVDGNENDADTYRAFYKHTGSLLKSNGIALLRCDHEGKDGGQGQRGSSAKNDDVDAVYRLTARDTKVTLGLLCARVAWMPATIQMKRVQDPHLRHVLLDSSELAPNAMDLVCELDELSISPTASYREVNAILTKKLGHGRRKEDVYGAQRLRKARR